MARTRYRFAEHHVPHFLTCTVVEWLPVFSRPEAAQVLFDAWTWQQQYAALRLYGFVVLENHLHAVAQVRAPVGLGYRAGSAGRGLTIPALVTPLRGVTHGLALCATGPFRGRRAG